MLYRAATAAIIRIVAQPEGGAAVPGPVDLGVEREVLLPAADGDPVVSILGHGGIKEADRGALLQQARVGCPPAGVALEETPGLVVGEAEGVLEVADGEEIDAHLCDGRERRGLVLRELHLLAPGRAGEGGVEPRCRHEVLFPGDDPSVIAAVPLEVEEPGVALDQVKEHGGVPAVLSHR